MLNSQYLYYDFKLSKEWINLEFHYENEPTLSGYFERLEVIEDCVRLTIRDHKSIIPFDVDLYEELVYYLESLADFPVYEQVDIDNDSFWKMEIHYSNGDTKKRMGLLKPESLERERLDEVSYWIRSYLNNRLMRLFDGYIGFFNPHMMKFTLDWYTDFETNYSYCVHFELNRYENTYFIELSCSDGIHTFILDRETVENTDIEVILDRLTIYCMEMDEIDHEITDVQHFSSYSLRVEYQVPKGVQYKFSGYFCRSQSPYGLKNILEFLHDNFSNRLINLICRYFVVDVQPNEVLVFDAITPGGVRVIILCDEMWIVDCLPGDFVAYRVGNGRDSARIESIRIEKKTEINQAYPKAIGYFHDVPYIGEYLSR